MGEKINRGKEKIMNKMDIPKDYILDLPKITILGGEEITIENHQGITLFEKNMIKIKASVGSITIVGEGFEILYIATSTIVISGTFKSVEHER